MAVFTTVRIAAEGADSWFSSRNVIICAPEMIFSIPYNPSVSMSLTHDKRVNLHFHPNFL